MSEYSEKYEKGMSSFPMEVCSILRKTQTFAIQNGLSPAGVNGDDNQPLKLYSSFSRFPICIIEKGNNITANIDVKVLPYIMTMTDKFIEADLFKTDNNTEEINDSLPYTCKMTAGANTKGKTPAQYILEDGEDKAGEKINDLRELYKWFKENVEKDPSSKFAEGNKKQMEAITQAANLYKNGELKNYANAGVSGTQTIYSSGFRPLLRREQRNGKSFVYEYMITYGIGNNYPITITIKNYYAEVQRTQNGGINVITKTKENEIRASMHLSIEEWLWALHMMDANMHEFENTYFETAYKVADNRREQNSKNAQAD